MDITDSSGYKDFVWAVEIHRLSLNIIGLWPKNDIIAMKSLWSKLYAGIILIMLIFICNVPMICAITQVWGDMVLVIDILHMTLTMLTIPMKYIIMQWKQTAVLSIVNMMAEDWMAIKSDAEKAVMIKQAQTARLIIIIGYIFAISGVLIVIISAYFGIQVMNATNFTDRIKALPLEPYRFYNTDKSPQYELTFCIHTITLFFAGNIYMSVDFFLLLIIFHICGQLENFTYRLVNLVSCKNFSKILNSIVTTHLRLIRFTDYIENIYSLMMLILIFYFCIVFCLSGFLFTILLTKIKMNEVSVTQMLYLMMLLLVLLTNTFAYCGAGELVMEQCNAVHRAIYNLEWYKLESRKAKNLILLMVRANHPFRITAGKIVPLTMATFCSILKTSSGYISFLLTKHD